MKFHYHLLVNPAAGSGNGAKNSEKIISLLKKNHYSYTTYITEKAGDESSIATRLAAETLLPWQEETSHLFEEREYPLLLVLGGDGTLHEVLNCFYHLEVNLPVAYLPSGSGNDLARAIGLPREIEKTFWHIIKTKEPQAINVITYTEQIQEKSGLVFNNLGIGLDASVVAAANQSITKQKLNKFQMGSFSYIFSIMRVLFTQKGFPILVDVNGQEMNFQKAFLCTTTNHPYFGGGVPIAPTTVVTKEELDLVVVERVALFKILWLIFLLLRKKHTKSRYFHQVSAKKLRLISTVPQYGQADGEVIEKQPFDIQFALAKQLFWY